MAAEDRGDVNGCVFLGCLAIICLVAILLDIQVRIRRALGMLQRVKGPRPE